MKTILASENAFSAQPCAWLARIFQEQPALAGIGLEPFHSYTTFTWALPASAYQAARAASLG